MTILFIQPNSLNPIIERANHIYNFEPLGIYYLASSVINQNEVYLLDLINEPNDSLKTLQEGIGNYKPEVIVFSALSSVKTGMINILCKYIKELDSNIITVVGGPHAFLMPTDFHNAYIDFLIKNNSIDYFVQIIRLLNKGYSLTKVKGECTPYENLPEIDVLNYLKPLRNLGNNYKNKYKISIGKPGLERIREKISSIKTTSGCPYRCNFCCLWQLYPQYKKRSILPIIEELQQIDSEYIFFADDESMIDMNYINDIAISIYKNDIKKKFIMYARVDSVVKNESIMENWAHAGLKQIWIGLEGANDAQLLRYKKNNTVLNQKKAIKIAQKHNISIHATALVDHTFSKVDFDNMLYYTKEHLGLTSCHFFILTPFKGSSYYNKILKESSEKLLTLNPDHYSIRQCVIKPEKMDVQDFHYLYAELQRKFNSEKIPFTCNHFVKDDYRKEFNEIKKLNELLYENILNSHLEYATTLTNNLATEYALY